MSITQEKIEQVKKRFGIVGQSPLLNQAIERAVKVAPTDLSVLLTGQSGVGKEGFSQIIHHLSRRKHNKFIAINCGAIPEGTIDSELFGHEKGAFTSAVDTRKGYFETVNGGTIFLDEVGELPLGTQSRLLRVLETGEFLKVGSSKVQKTDVRVIAATNKDLRQSLQEKKFREDLYYRLSTVQIHIPTLMEREGDILMLFAKFASDFADKHHIPPVELTPAAQEELKNYSWPGNIRQLKNFVEEISVLEPDRTLDAETIRQYLPAEETTKLTHVKGEKEQEGSGFRSNEEREILYKILFDLKGDVSELKKLMQEFFKAFPNSYQPNFTEPDSQEQEAERKLLEAAGQRTATEPIHTEPARPDEAVRAQPSPNPHVNPQVSTKTEATEEEDEILDLHELEKNMIEKALKKYEGKRKVAAKELGISERTLYRKIKEYNLENTWARYANLVDESNTYRPRKGFHPCYPAPISWLWHL